MRTTKVIPAVVLLLAGSAPAVSMAQLSANVGWTSEYIYRGVYQEASSASAGIDYEDDSGFYVGAWGADVGNGLETDLYFGYSGSSGDFGYSVGWTGYFYTEDDPLTGFYDTITEINLGISYGIFALDHAIGEEDGWGFPVDYTFTSVTISPENGPYFKYGSFGDQYDGSYIEIGYGFELMDFDLNVAFTYGLDVGDPGNIILLSEENALADTALVFGISKSFDIGGSE